MRSRQASVSSTGETFLDRMRSDASFRVSEAKSSDVSAKVRRAATAAPRPAAIHSRRVEVSMCCFTASGTGVSIEQRARYTIASSRSLLLKRSLPLFLFCAAVALAEHYDTSVFGALQWRSIGPVRGG